MAERLSDMVRRLRTEAGMTQRTLADAVGISDGMVAHYESGKRGMGPDVAEEMADVLRLAPSARAALIAAARDGRGRPSSVDQRLADLESQLAELRGLVEELASGLRSDRGGQ